MSENVSEIGDFLRKLSLQISRSALVKKGLFADLLFLRAMSAGSWLW
jgi:hypothetical protein